MRRAVLMIGAALLTAGSALAEVSVTRTSSGVDLYFEPAASGPWGRVRTSVPAADLLNAQGDERGDGWPATQRNVRTGTPDVAWASAGEESDIFFSWHDSIAWRGPTNVSASAGADFRPVLAQDAHGNRFVAWTNVRSGHQSVRFAGLRNDGQAQTQPLELSLRQNEGMRPSLAADVDGHVYVAYEEMQNGSDEAISIAIDRLVPSRDAGDRLNCSGENTIDLGRTVTIGTGLPPSGLVAAARVSAEAGHLWVTWIDASGRLGWVERLADGVFSSPQYETFDAGAGDEPARTTVRTIVLSH